MTCLLYHNGLELTSQYPQGVPVSIAIHCEGLAPAEINQLRRQHEEQRWGAQLKGCSITLELTAGWVMVENDTLRMHIENLVPGRVAQLVGALSCTPKGCRFKSDQGTYLGCGFDHQLVHEWD